MKSLRVIVIIVLISCFLQTNAGAQQKDRQASTTPTGLALEVTYWKGDKPAYLVVPNNAWYGRFRVIESSRKAAAGSLRVQAVGIDARLEGEVVRVIVSVHRGEKFFERQDPVGSYVLRENEKLVVNDMTAFGLEPFEIALVRVTPRSVPLPSVTNNTSSVQVLNVQPVDSTFPAYKLTLLNTSNKNISALFVDMFLDGRRRTSSMPHNQDGAPLIPAGETYEFRRQLNNVALAASQGYAPETPPNQAVVITTAVFEDGTYEGDAYSAAKFRAFSLGDKKQLEQLVSLYQKALESTDSNVGIVLDNLRSQVNALRVEAGGTAFKKLLSDFASLPENERASLKDAVELTMFEWKKVALKEIDEFRKEQTSEEGARAWLSERRDRFQKRLDHLQKL